MGGCVGKIGLWSGFDCVVKWLPGGEGHRSGGDLGEDEVSVLCCCLVPLCVVMGGVGESIHVPTRSVSAWCVLLEL